MRGRDIARKPNRKAGVAKAAEAAKEAGRGAGRSAASSPDRPRVEVLLSTYNGALYLGEQLDSIISQGYANWTMLARDDGSTDESPAILEEYAARHPGRIKIISGGGRRLGACASFAFLLERSTAPYVMFCDQDDLWLPEKIEVTLSRMLVAEEGHPGRPVLVHTDMFVTDRGLNIMAGSFWSYQGLDPRQRSLKNLLLLNNVTGCALMANRALADAAVPVPPEAILHDWWLALVASGLGTIEHLDAPTIKYRQHGANEAGAVRYSLMYFVRRFRDLGRTTALISKIVAQAAAFYSAYGDRLSVGDRETARAFSGILDLGRLSRPSVILGRGLRVNGFLRNIGIVTLLVLMGPGPGRGGMGRG